MATVKAFIRPTKQTEANIRIRLSVSRSETHYGVSPISIPAAWWNAGSQEIKNRLILPDGYSREGLNKQIKEAKEKVINYYKDNQNNLCDNWITLLLSGALQDREEDQKPSFFEVFDIYISAIKAGNARKMHIRSLKTTLLRFEKVTLYKFDFGFHFDPSKLEAFLLDESLYARRFPDLYKKVRRTKRGLNTVTGLMKITRAFYAWALLKQYAVVDPFKGYQLLPEVYADPIPLMFEELDLLAACELSGTEALVRDMFLLHCYLGCRVGDLLKLTTHNINGDILSYIPEKTIEERPATVYVPLHPKAIALIDKLKRPNGRVVPTINVSGKSGYNKTIKEVCRKAGIARHVIVIDPITRTPQTRELCDVVTSHTARKTFINCNYIETQDPALISQMTGHSPNSKAFARYRDIDINILRAQIKKSFGE